MRLQILHIKMFVLMICNILLTGKLNAQVDSMSNTPYLNGHYFVSTMNIPGAFIKSHFGMNIGVASTTGFQDKILVIDDQEIIALKGSLIFADLNFDYRQKIKDWIAFNARVGVTARIGTEVQSLLSQGINTVSSFSLGWSIRLLERDKYLLSGNISVNNFGVSYIDIKGFVEDFVKDSTLTSISRNVPILNGGFGLQFAYGINDLIGFQAHASALYGDSFERGATDIIYHMGGAVDFNLATTTRVPLGFSLGFIASSLPDIVQVKGKSATNFNFKLAFMGSEHYDFGLEVSSINVPLPDVEDKVRSTGVFITSKYYFN